MSKFTKIDVLAGLFVILLGVLSFQEASRFQIGTARAMGPGYFPLYIGIFMLLVGAGIIIGGSRHRDEEPRIGFQPRLRALLLILAAGAAFALLIQRYGMVPATAAAVFLGTMADDETSIRQKLALTAAIPIVSVIIFILGLGMRVDIIGW